VVLFKPQFVGLDFAICESWFSEILPRSFCPCNTWVR